MTRRLILDEDDELGRVRARPQREQDEEAAELAALDALAMPDLTGALPEALGHEGEHAEAMSEATPATIEDPEASSATAHTLDGSWEDATADRNMGTRAEPSSAELDALDAMAGRRAEPSAPHVDPVAPSVPERPEATVRPDDSMSIEDDSPDVLHAMAGAEPEMPGALRQPLGGSFDEGTGAPEMPQITMAGTEDDINAETRPNPIDEPEFTYEADDELDALDAMTGTPKPAPTEDAPTLDEGLPSEGDIQTARDWDVPRSIFRSLQNGLLGAIGRPRREYHGEGDALEQERTEGMLERTQAKTAQHRQEVSDAASAEARAEASARADEGLAIRREGLDVQRARVDATREATDALTQQRTASATHTATLDEIARASRADREDPTSAISIGAQNAYRAALAVLPEGMRTRVAGALGGDPSTMSAAELEGVVRRLQGIGVRGTGGGGGASRGTTASLATALVERGIAETPEEAAQIIASIGASGARTAIQQDLAPAARARTGTDEQGDEIVPGVRAGLDLPAGRLRSMQDRLTTYRDGARALGEIETLLRDRGPETVINPAVQAEIEPSLVTLRAMVAQIQGTGIINPGERPLIDATLPDPSSLSGWTLGRLDAAMRGWRRRLDGATSSVLESAGVDDEGIERGVQYMHGHRSPSARHARRAPTTGGGDRVRIRRPDGRGGWTPGTVPRAAWEASSEAERAGAEEVR